MGGSKVVALDMIKSELFCPVRQENKDTTGYVRELAVEVAGCLLRELRDPKKVTSDYLSSGKGEMSWGQTSKDKHAACIGHMATNDATESPFAALT